MDSRRDRDGLLTPGIAPRRAPLRRDQGLSICMDIAHDCNLRCSYCYAGGGAYGGRVGLMSARTAVDGIRSVAALSGVEHVDLHFFGGEPLLNVGVLRHVIRRARNIDRPRFRFAVTTNAVTLRRREVELLEGVGGQLTVSIDGGPSDHDASRRSRDGGPSHARVLSALRRSGAFDMPRVVARCTLACWPPGLERRILYLLGLGFKTIDLSFVSTASGYEVPRRYSPVTLIEDVRAAAQMAYDLWLDGKATVRPFTRLFEIKLLEEQPPAYCEAGRRMYALTPEGRWLPCFRFPQSVLGSVSTAFEEIMRSGEKWRAANLLPRESCESCAARPSCSFVCPADRLVQGHSSLQCQLTRAVVAECAAIVSSRSESDKAVLSSIRQRAAAIRVLGMRDRA